MKKILQERVPPADVKEVFRLDSLGLEKRLNEAYYVLNIKSGKKMRFQMEPWHKKILDALYRRRRKKLLIVKARQVYVTTFMTILMLDIIARHRDFPMLFFNYTREMSELSLEGLPAYIARNSPYLQHHRIIDQAKEIFSPITNSRIMNRIGGRGSTPKFSLITEAAVFASLYPDKYITMLNGLLPGAEYFPVVQESTPYGNTGRYVDDCNMAHERQTKGIKTSPFEWELIFIPWYEKRLNARKWIEGHEFEGETVDYFKSLEDGHRLTFTREQMLWHEQTRFDFLNKSLKRMKEEHPTVYSECFKSNPETYILQAEMLKMSADNRYREFPIESGKDCFVFWDFGFNSNTAFMVAQRWGPKRWRIINFCQARGKHIDWFFNALENMDLRYVRHVLPHDGKAQNFVAAKITDMQDMTMIRYFKEIKGIHNVDPPVDRVTVKELGFRISQDFAGQCEMNSGTCKVLYSALMAVRRHMDIASETLMPKLREKDVVNDAYDCFELCARYSLKKEGAPSSDELDAYASAADDFDVDDIDLDIPV